MHLKRNVFWPPACSQVSADAPATRQPSAPPPDCGLCFCSLSPAPQPPSSCVSIVEMCLSSEGDKHEDKGNPKGKSSQSITQTEYSEEDWTVVCPPAHSPRSSRKEAWTA
ncbi:hypothetical protein E2C01_029953 [Portunus trituberculatus]|uniref:Uncharacterized protein n=1 Tax=Portunus trituberculatus TaxID=210409 RepID=A0A5B7EUD3_PORTR|nr:hypothetical protein [Portunus trituberculatus]